MIPPRATREENLTLGLSVQLIPDHMHKAIRAYVLDGRRPGDFLQAVLQNNLMDAVTRADDENLPALRAWAMLLYNFTPEACWGSAERVDAWVKAHSEQSAIPSLTPVTSSNIEAIGHQGSQLFIRFRGMTYRYEHVSAPQFQAVMKSVSKGKAVRRFTTAPKAYPCTKVHDEATAEPAVGVGGTAA